MDCAWLHAAGTAAAENLGPLERLETLSLQDELTRLPNRRSGERALQAALAEAERHGGAVAVVLLDVDHFKAVNDTHGHPFGDRVLVEVARRLRVATRAGETVVRWGGEEFLAVIPCPAHEGAQVAERLRLAGSGTVDVDGVRVDLTLSCGVAVSASGAADASAVITRADESLYQAKAGGRSRTVELPTSPLSG